MLVNNLEHLHIRPKDGKPKTKTGGTKQKARKEGDTSYFRLELGL